MGECSSTSVVFVVVVGVVSSEEDEAAAVLLNNAVVVCDKSALECSILHVCCCCNSDRSSLTQLLRQCDAVVDRNACATNGRLRPRTISTTMIVAQERRREIRRQR